MTSHRAQAVTDIHLRSDLEFEIGKNSDMKYIYIFAFSAFFLLIVACVNFVNLTSIGLSSRVKEIGVRKVSGASRKQLIAQFLFESVLTTLLAFLVGILILALTYTGLAELIDLPISVSEVFHPLTVLLLALIVVSTGLLAGLYPSLVLSRVDPVSVFKGGRFQASGKGIRKALVIFQFGIAIVLLVFTMISKRQVDYMLGKDHGYDMDNVLLVEMTSTGLPGKMPAIREAMMNDPRVLNVTCMNDVIGVGNNNHDFWYEGVPKGEFRYFPALMVDEHFLNTLDIDVIAGRNYDHERQREDSLSVIINESLSEYLGFDDPEDALGEYLFSKGGSEKIIGVCADFNFKSLHHPVGPFVLEIPDRGQTGQFYYFMRTMAIKVDSVDAKVLAGLETEWDAFVNNKPFDYRMLKDEISALYKEESRMGTVLALFSGLSIMIACMGLFALTWFLAKLKMKEIALRKVLGAELPHLILISTKEQMVMVGIAIVFAMPVAYILVNNWLSSFAHRITPGASPYVLAASVALVVAFGSMVFLAFRTSQQDPAPILKYE
jgi:putative ABC transport system permease protein